MINNPQQGPNPYLRTKVMTASREELRLMLYDGCLRFCHQAKAGLDAENFEQSYENLLKAQKIVLELSTSLNRDAAPEICDKLTALYNYVFKLLVDASMKRDGEKVDEAIRLISYERETWQLLIEKNNGHASGGSPSEQSQQTALSGLSKSA
ncbi:flagellar export chaperone FliS [Mucisphaera calidilacus]|uniref:flagellar export chaperone FliS n=1 Tax=Mucisphaera calidilacus TaxID=2527982 RepID=UPI0011A2ECE4|nr:flagellar export chaperone FliS [Mucisphaera calidilacus]